MIRKFQIHRWKESIPLHRIPGYLNFPCGGEGPDWIDNFLAARFHTWLAPAPGSLPSICRSWNQANRKSLPETIATYHVNEKILLVTSGLLRNAPLLGNSVIIKKRRNIYKGSVMEG